jgi:16S rRNA (uracil1498-N3)-methyltransferase
VSARFYCPDPPRDGRLRLSRDESRHLTRVCRLGVGDRVEVFDGRGFLADAEVVSVAGDSGELAVAGEPLRERRLPCSLTLATAVPKGDRFDWLVEKVTELGVERLIPLVTDRSVVEPRGSKLSRLRRLIIEASKQCRHDRLMVLDDPAPWTKWVRSCPESIRLLADPDGCPPGQWPPLEHGRSFVLAVGPEGGFTAGERALADQAGWRPINLSVHTLRIETAGLAGCAALLTLCRGGGQDKTGS